MDKTNVMAYFSIYGDHFPINEVTQLLGIEPTKSYNKGEVIVRPTKQIEFAIRIKAEFDFDLYVNPYISNFNN